MNDYEEKEVSKFVDLVNIWSDTIVWKDVSYVVLKTPHGSSLLYGRIIFHTLRPDQNKIKGFSIETNSVIAGRVIEEIEGKDIDGCIKLSVEGKIIIPEGEFSLSARESRSLYFTTFEFSHPAVKLVERMPALRVAGCGVDDLMRNSLYDSIEAIDWDLKGADQPYDNLDEILGLLWFLDFKHSSDMTLLEVISHAPVLIRDDSTLANDKAQICLIASKKINTAKVKVGYKLMYKDRFPDRGVILKSDFEWRVEDGLQVSEASLDVGDAYLMQAFVSYDDVFMHQWFLEDSKKRPNEHLVTHAILDNDLDKLRKTILDHATRKQRNNFETGISVLLSILGFKVTHYGDLPLFKEAVDLLAYTYGGNILVIECTTDIMDDNKLAKLKSRTMRLIAELNQSGYGYVKVQPTIVTSVNKKEFSVYNKVANEFEVALICKEEIEWLLREVKAPVNTERLFDLAVGFVPSVEQNI